MSIGSKIKELRLKKNITQEELLGVTSQSVSQWERDRTAPDVSQLPALAYVFGVSTDVILEVDIHFNRENVKKIVRQSRKAGEKNDLETAENVLREGLRHYPNNGALLEELIHVLFTSNRNDEILAEGEKLLEISGDGGSDPDTRRYHVIVQILSMIYNRRGQYEKAEEMARKLPNSSITRKSLLVQVGEPKERLKRRRQNLVRLLEDTLHSIGESAAFSVIDGEEIYTPEEVGELYEKGIQLIHLFYEQGDAGYFEDILYDFYCKLARNTMERGLEEETLEHLDHAADSAIKFVAYVEHSCRQSYSSVLFKGECQYHGWKSGEEENSAADLLKWME